jgi:hypothetical protein
MYLRITMHDNEHMGQLIANARMNGIVPRGRSPISLIEVSAALAGRRPSVLVGLVAVPVPVALPLGGSARKLVDSASAWSAAQACFGVQAWS